MEELIFSVSGARGVVGRGLDPLVLARLAGHYGAWIGSGRIVLGRDSRVSGEMARAAVTAGLLGAGVNVCDIGRVSTPTLGVAVRKLAASGGIEISASHNPAEWNALKFFSSRGMLLTAREGAQLRARVEAGPPSFAGAGDLGGLERRGDLPSAHVGEILACPFVDASAVRGAALHAVVDCVNGVGGEVARILLEALGVRTTWLHEAPTGRFPRNPEPLPENLGELAERVRSEGADVGFALDPDADRVAAVDESGRPIGEETTLAVVVDSVLPRAGGDVVVNVSTTMVIEEIAARCGARVHRTPVGEVNVVEKMLSCGARIGGEGNGGVILPEVHAGRDGLLGIALWLDVLARERVKVSELVARIPSTVMRKVKIEIPGVPVDDLLRELESGFPGARVDRSDGLKLFLEGGWVHVRKSNTEPVLRLLTEATNGEAADSWVERARELVSRAVAAASG